MKAGTHNHLKVKRLKRLLGIPLYRAVGILETIWLLCVDCCDEGNIGKFTDAEIADYLEWDGEPSKLVQALADSEWFEVSPQHRYVVADWEAIKRDYPISRWRDHTQLSVARHTVAAHLSASLRAGLEANLTAEEWLDVIATFNNACAYCRRTHVPLDIDHLTPSSRGGPTIRENIVPACHRCNRSKGASMPLEFFTRRAQR